MHFSGAARCQAPPGCPPQNPPDGSLSRDGNGNLPARDFCCRRCAKWFTVHWVVWNLMEVSPKWQLAQFRMFLFKMVPWLENPEKVGSEDN